MVTASCFMLFWLLKGFIGNTLLVDSRGNLYSYISVKNRKNYITLYTSLKPPLPSRWSNKYLSFNVGWSLNLKGGGKKQNSQLTRKRIQKGSVHNKVPRSYSTSSYFFLTQLLIPNSVPYFFICMTITHLNTWCLFIKLNIHSWIFRFNDQL